MTAMNGFVFRLSHIAAVAGIVLLSACSSSTELAASSPSADSKAPPSPTSAASPSPDPSPSASPSPSLFILPSPTPLPVGTPVQRQVLSPAKVLPIAPLCSYPVYDTADGNYRPTLCRGGAINVIAWRSYVPLGINLMSLGRGATIKDIRSAMCRDMAKTSHATLEEEHYAYELCAAYYGWTFRPEPTCR